MRTAIYALIYALLLQFGLPYVIPDAWIHSTRVEYDTIKNNMSSDLGLAMDRVAREIKRNPDQDYVILIGDSVTYSGPGKADESIGYYLEQYSQEHGHPLKVYNFAQPGNMSGDVYAEVLMLKEHGVPLKRVVLNEVYSNFAFHPPTEPIFDWLGEDLHRLDPEAWTIAHGQAAAPVKPMVKFRQDLLNYVSLWRYRDFLRTKLYAALHLDSVVEAKDTRPWTAKKAWLTDLMKDPLYQRFVTPQMVPLTSDSAEVALTERTLDALKGSQVLVWFAPFNQELMKDGVANPAYQENVKKLDAWFAGHQNIDYVQWRTAISSDLFTDHTHLTPPGYAQVAALLGDKILTTHP